MSSCGRMSAGAYQEDMDMMAVLGGGSEPFELLIGQLMTSSNEQRGQAERLFNQCKVHHPDLLVSKLVLTLHASTHVEVRALSTVLLRKLITKDDVSLWPRLSSATQTTVKSQLLFSVRQEHDRSIVKKLCDTVAELAASILDEGLWPELLPFMFQCVRSETERLQETALFMFAQLAQYVGPQLSSHLSTLHTVLRQCLASSTSSEVRIAALRATTNFVQTLQNADDRERFQDLLPGMMQTLSLALSSNEESIAQDALEMFIEVAGTEPGFLRRQLVNVVSSMLQIAEADQLEEGTRHLAVEFLITLAEARERAPGMMRKLPQFIARLFASLLSMLLDIDDDQVWHTADTEDEEAGYSSNYEVAQECLDRLAISLGGNTILPVASQLLAPYISDGNWKKRHAALVSLAQIAEGCAKVMIKSLEPVLTMVLSSFQDPHPRVRWAAINAIGQLSTDLGPELQEGYHQHVLPALIVTMDDFQNPRVQAHAAAAILNFSENCTPEILAPYLDDVISKLLVLLQNGKRMVQEGALTALASVADSSQGYFDKYYDSVMPFLKAILLNANDKSSRILRAKSMECISLVGMAVGKDKFRADAKQVMEVLINIQGLQMEDDDPTTSYMLQAWARLCKCLGHEFLPYMGVVMPPLLRSAQLKPDVTIMDADSEDDGNESDGSVETITVGDKKIGIRTSVLEEKATACNMLCCYADELKEGFYPWIDQVATILVPLLKFYFHEEVRKAAVSAMPELLRSGKLAVERGHAQGRGQAYVKQLLDYIVPPLIEALHKEPETEICASMLEALNECIQFFGSLSSEVSLSSSLSFEEPVYHAVSWLDRKYAQDSMDIDISGHLLDHGYIARIVEEFKDVIIASNQRRKDRADRKHIEGFDDEERELLLEENEQEQEIFEQVGECLGTLIKTFKGSFLPYFDDLLIYLTPMLSKDSSPGEKRVAICIFDDVAEQTRDLALKYYGAFLPSLLEACTDTNADVRQAAVYGVGVCAEYGGHTFQPIVAEALHRLTTLITDPSSHDQGSIMATDNAVSALGKICEHQRHGIDTVQVVSAWLSCLPLRGDLVEARIVHEQLCSMVERSDVVVLGPNNSNIPKIVSVFMEVLGARMELVSTQTATRMVNLLRQIQQASTWSSLQPQQQMSLHSFLLAYV